MGVSEIVIIIISLLMLYQGYRLGEKNFREALVFIGVLLLVLILFVVIVYNIQH